MCGCCGVMHWDDQPVADTEIAAMIQRIRYRGPDEVRTAKPQPSVGLGHARLSVIDLSHLAQQPMSSEDQRVWIVYNGEVYNFQALREELMHHGCRFRSRSDTEVILQAYEVWGAACIPRLDGMFALAIWDGRRRELLLARDRSGKKPLFYAASGACFAFASEIKALFAHRHVRCEIQDASIPAYLAFGYAPSPATFYRNIWQLPPASVLRVSQEHQEPRVESYWDLSFDAVQRSGIRAAARARLRELLVDAVRKRLIADVPLGAFLSGGIDSTVVVGIMSQLLGQRVKTFSIGFEGDARFDETRFARLAAGRFKTYHTEFIVRPASFNLIERLVLHHDQPFGDSSAVPTYLLAQLTRSHVTVALNGDGGDELFAGYWRLVAMAAAERTPRWVREGLSRVLAWLPESASQRTASAVLRRFAAAAKEPLLRRYVRWSGCVPDPDALLLPARRTEGGAGTLAEELLGGYRVQARGWSPLSQALYLNFKEYLAQDLHVKMDRCSMAHGLETRSPFLDTALVEFAAALPDSYKASWRGTKVLLREAFADLLPPEIQRRGKMGFGVPLGTWFRGAWQAPLRELLEDRGARAYRYLDRAAVLPLIRWHLEGQADYGHQLWALLTLEVWLRLLERPTVWGMEKPQSVSQPESGEAAVAGAVAPQPRGAR